MYFVNPYFFTNIDSYATMSFIRFANLILILDDQTLTVVYDDSSILSTLTKSKKKLG